MVEIEEGYGFVCADIDDVGIWDDEAKTLPLESIFSETEEVENDVVEREEVERYEEDEEREEDDWEETEESDDEEAE